MSLFSKDDIWQLIEHERTFSRDDNNETALEGQVQPASFDITIGRIYIPPEVGDEEAGKVVEREDFYTLQPGGMALVLSREHVKINSETGGFVFPKNGDFALKGLLFTNFGHIDPGFSGHLRFTVINMGRKEFTLRHGDRIAGVTIFRLTTPTSNYRPTHSSSCETQARVLARDFLNIESRVAEKAKNSVKEEFTSRDRTSFFINTATMAFLMVVTAVTFLVTYAVSFQSAIGTIYEKLAATTSEIQKVQYQLEMLKRSDSPPTGQKK